MSNLPEVDGIDDFIITVFFVPVQIFGLTTMSRIMEEKRVIWPSVLDEPVHSSQDILLCWLAHGVLLIVGEDNHILALITEVLNEISRHVPNIIDTASELPALAEVVDAD